MFWSGIGLDLEFYFGDTDLEVLVRKVLNSEGRSHSKTLL